MTETPIPFPPKRKPPAKRPSSGAGRSSGIGALIALAILVIAVLYWFRPILHPFAMRFYVAPLVWLVPFLIFLSGALYAALRVRGNSGSRPVRSQFDGLRGVTDMDDLRNRVAVLGPATATLMASAVLAFVVFVIAGIFNAPLVSKSLYSNTEYNAIKTLPPSGAVRMIPKEVAARIAQSGFNSPTEHLSDFHLVKRDGKLAWTALRSPEGAYRTLTQQSAGILELNASSSSRQTKLIDAKFKTAPGMYITDNLRWRLLKKHFFVELDDPIAITDSKGKPLIAVSYMKYKGFLIRRPVFGGVFIVHPNGEIEDLEPAEAMKRKELLASGRVFPEKLARREQEAYAYKNGLFNKWFSHTDQTQISHTENNPQPYLLDFGKGGFQYVSAAEPYGRAFAVNAIFLTDAVTGKMTLWRPARNTELTGNRRVLETVRSLSIPGIVFAETSTNAPSDRGGFRVIEPRPVVVKGRLVFMASIVPDNANNVSKTVFIDAETNRVAAIFDNDSDPRADEKVADYLSAGAVPTGSTPAQGGASGATGSTGATGASGSASTGKRDARERLDDVLRRQRELIQEIEDLRDEL